MNIFDSSFRKIRNDFIIPRISHGIQYKKADYWSFKECLVNNISSFKKLSGKTYQISLPLGEYFKSIHCEIELFTNKYEIQLIDFINQTSSSQTWSFVTLYYFNFFVTTCLFRHLGRGFIFLTSNHTKKIEQIAFLLNGDIISLDKGNFYFSSAGLDSYGNMLINLSFKGDNVHKSTWIQLQTILKELSQNGSNDEKAILDLLISHFNFFAQEYPSILRNKLNYQGDSSLLDLSKELTQCEILTEIDSTFLRKLTSLNLDRDSDVSKMKSFELLTSYLYSLVNTLNNEYHTRSNFGKDFVKARKKYKTATKKKI